MPGFSIKKNKRKQNNFLDLNLFQENSLLQELPTLYQNQLENQEYSPKNNVLLNKLILAYLIIFELEQEEKILNHDSKYFARDRRNPNNCKSPIRLLSFRNKLPQSGALQTYFLVQRELMTFATKDLDKFKTVDHRKFMGEEPVRRQATRTSYLHKLGFGNGSLPASRKSAEDPLFSLQTMEDGDGSDKQRPEFTMQFLNMKSQDDFRVNFLKKLSYSGVWVPHLTRPPQHQTVIIFDWDDTLLCTSFLNVKSDLVQSPVVQKNLHAIAQTGIQLLETALKYGHTFIITNAIRGWVEYSTSKYIPMLMPSLKKVKIISARDDYEQQFPGQYHQWKIEAFLKVQKELNSQIITNIVSLGDSNIEMDAVHVMGSEFSEALIKTIKFRETPTPEELAKQLELVSQKFDKILVNARNLKISLERKWVAGHSPKSNSSAIFHSTTSTSSSRKIENTQGA